MEALALQFCILTTARTGEVTCAEWAEVDTEKRVWTIPRTKTKNGKEHRIPLSDDTLAVLAQAKALAVGDCPIVFPRDLTGRALTHDALRYQLQCMGRSDITVHGFRSSFRTWCAERTNFPRSVAEAALAHTVGDATEKSYQRGDMFEKRRKLMDAWAGFCSQPSPAGEVVAFPPVKLETL
jgi:integrase